jgi:hypothetical protein
MLVDHADLRLEELADLHNELWTAKLKELNAMDQVLVDH